MAIIHLTTFHVPCFKRPGNAGFFLNMEIWFHAGYGYCFCGKKSSSHIMFATPYGEQMSCHLIYVNARVISVSACYMGAPYAESSSVTISMEVAGLSKLEQVRSNAFTR
jgi:hypothetical protein